ncbi:uncharacterized protein LOC62_04G006213 [Vanrija pseudolonga]|uniref:RRM domain-containing protein n=1 Tax=Vanrija pseudolonga TaxID=143232 RepID=A0AAF0Y9V7_9TREE|nr:hypothetical protein LOC62_04G006213 [Vanrija pseudolonga]
MPADRHHLPKPTPSSAPSGSSTSREVYNAATVSEKKAKPTRGLTAKPELFMGSIGPWKNEDEFQLRLQARLEPLGVHVLSVELKGVKREHTSTAFVKFNSPEDLETAANELNGVPFFEGGKPVVASYSHRSMPVEGKPVLEPSPTLVLPSWSAEEPCIAVPSIIDDELAAQLNRTF